jgi:hypothetical protein
MARTRSNTKIVLQENGAFDRPTFERLSADGNIYPGLLLVLTSAGKVDGAGDAHDGPWIVALENQYIAGDLSAGDALSTAYASGVLVPHKYLIPGDLVQLVAAASQTLSVGDEVEVDTGGYVVELSAGTRVGYVEVATTTGAGATAAVTVRIG